MGKRPINNRLSKKLKLYFRRKAEHLFICDLGIVIVTKDDKVYVLSRNDCVSLGLGNNDSVNEIDSKIVNELCNKEIVEFANEMFEMIARSKNGQIFFYSMNKMALTRNHNIDHEFLKNKNIISISCGCNHSLALSITGEVYEFGVSKILENFENQRKGYVFTSFKVKFDSCNEKIKMISCGGFSSMALTESGQVFSWGQNLSGQLGLGHTINSDTPQLVRIENVSIDKISCGHKHSLLLSSEGDIYVFGNNSSGELGIGKTKNQLSPIKLNTSNKFVDIATHSNRSVSIARSTSDVHFIWGECGQQEILFEPKETNLKSFHEIFANHLGISFGCQSFNVISQFSDTFIRNGDFTDLFREIQEIGSGSFGTVFKVKDRNGFLNAIKKIEINSKNEFEILKEFMIAQKLRNLNTEGEYIVGHELMWFENNLKSTDGEVKHEYSLSFYIQMELCDRNLKEIIDELNPRSGKPLTPMCYFIASELFFEILKGVRYLHNLNIIHRDLKPENIMLKNEMEGKLIRIADFGLMSFHDHFNKTHDIDVGDLKYMAPEVEISCEYNTKADIYSIGLIMQEIFNIQTDSKYEDEQSEHFLLMSKYRNASKISVRMTDVNPDERPNCDEVLKMEYMWGLDEHELNMNESDIENELLDIEERTSKCSGDSDVKSHECYLRSIVNTKLLHKSDEFLSWLLFLTEYFEESIKHLFIYRLRDVSKKIIVVTKMDKVYEFDSYSLDSMNEKSIVTELCDKGIVEIVNGWSHVIARNNKGQIYCWGSNSNGQLGNGKRHDLHDYPKLNESLKNEYIVSVCCGRYHSLALTGKGEVFAWGSNEHGEIGNGTEDSYQLIPIEVNGFNEEKVKQICCGKYHSMTLTENGNVFAWGYNGYGQLGIGHKIDSNKPKLIQLQNVFIDKISCGDSHSIFLSSDGDIYVFGNNNCGQLGFRSEEFQLNPKKLNNSIKFSDIAAHHLYNISMAKSVDGMIYVWGECGQEIIKEPKENKFRSFVDIFAKYLKITYGSEPVEEALDFMGVTVWKGVYYN